MSHSPKVTPSRQTDSRRQTRPYQLAYLYFKNNEFTQAEHAARDYVASNSQCDRGYRLLGDILHALNKRDEALNAYQKSLELNPNQEDVLFNICDLMTPDSADIERLEHWAERAAKSGFLDVADRFRRNIEAAKAAVFPENKKLNSVLQNIVRHERSPKPTERPPSSANGIDRVTPLKLLNEADVGFTGLSSRSLATPEKVLLQRQQETLLKNLKEDISKNLDSQQCKLSESTTGLMAAVRENRELILSVRSSVEEVMKEIRQLRSAVQKIQDGQSQTADATAKLTEAFNNFNLNYTGGLEDYEDENYEGYDEENENVYTSGVPETNQPLQLKNLPDFTQLQTAAQTSSVFSRIGTIPQPQTLKTLQTSQTKGAVPAIAASTIPTASTVPVLTSLLTPQSKPVSGTASTQATFTFGVPPTFGNSFPSSTPSTAIPSANNVFGGGGNSQLKFGQSSSFNFSFGQKGSEGKSDDEGEEEDDPQDLEAEPDVHFKPVIELPPEVDAVSGEEEEEELLKERCKVYRFTAGEWKERGTGEMKVLYNPARNKSRLLMRRDQVLKVVVNHLLTPDIELKGFEKVPPYKCYSWSALNASDGPPVPEVLCVRFKTEEIATAFLEAVRKGKQMHLSSPCKSPSKSEQSSGSDVQVVFVKETDRELAKKAEELQLPPNFYDYLKKEPCKGCVGCEDDSDQPKPSSSEKSPSVPKSSPATTSATSATSATSTTSATSATFVSSPLAPPKLNALSSNQTPTDAKSTTTFGAVPVFGSSLAQGTFSFGSTTTSTSSAPVFGSWSFGSSTPVFGFGGQASTDNTAKKDPQIPGTTTTSTASKTDSSSTASIFSSPQNSTPFSWGLGSNTKTIFGNTNLSDTNGVSEKTETTTFGFKFGGSSGGSLDSGFAWGNDNNKSASWLNCKPAPIFGESNGREDDDEDGGDDEGEEEHDPQFAPIIPLPDEVEVRTGEEDEEVIYCQRGKLYRFDAGVKQWKERGVGDLKILRHKDKPRFRLIMRREQVHKVACNHYLTKEINLKPFPNSETTLSWTAMDFSEEPQGEMQGFAVKFKTVDLKNAFQSKFEELQRQLP